MKRNSFALILLPVLMQFFAGAFITGCGETFDECAEREMFGTWENWIRLDYSDPFPSAFKNFWNIYDMEAMFPERYADRIVLNADGSYLIQDIQSLTTIYSLTEPPVGKLGLDGRYGEIIATFHFEERGTYEIHDPSTAENNSVIEFFPERIDVQIEDGAYFRTFPGGDKVYLDVELFNQWLNDAGVYGDTLIYPRYNKRVWDWAGERDQGWICR